MKKSEKLKGKRNRSTNFTPHETNLLLCLVEKYSTTLENKTENNAVTWQRKKQCWEKIADEFSGQSTSNRTATSLREKYENLKRQTKTKKEIYIIGDGRTSAEMANTDERIAALMGTSVYDSDKDLDSDAMQGPVVKNEVPEESEHSQYLCMMDDKDVKTETIEEYENAESIETETPKRTDIPSPCTPNVLKRNKPARLKVKKWSTQTRNDELLLKQKLFYENEDRRAEERHQLQMKKLNLKIDLLNIEKAMKTLQMNGIENLNKQSN